MFVRSCLLWARHRRLAFVVTISVLCFSLFFSRQASLSSRLSDYYPSQHAHVKLYREFTDMLKMTNTVIVVVTVREGSIFTSEALGKIHRLTVGLLETKGVNPFEVMSLTHPRLKNINVRGEGINILPVVEHPDQLHSPEELDHIKNAVDTNLGIRGVYISPDEKTALIRAGFWDGMAEPRTVFTRLQTLAENEQDANTDIVFTGNLVLAAWLINAAPRFLLFLLLSAGVLLVCSGHVFGFISGAGRVLLVNLIGALCGFSLLGLSGHTLEPLALVALLPLCARGVALVSQWHLSLANAQAAVATPFAPEASREHTLARTAAALGRPLNLALCLDAVVLLLLTRSDMPAVQALGYLSAGWLVGLLFSLWLVLPLWPAPVRASTPHSASVAWGGRFIEHCSVSLDTMLRSTAVRHGLISSLALLGFIAAAQLHAGKAMLGTTLFSHAHPFNKAFTLVNEKFIGVNQLIVIARAPKENAFRDPKALEALEAFQHYMAADEQFGGALAITGLTKSLTRMFHENVPKWEVIPSDIDSSGQVIFRIISSAATPSEVERFLSTDYHTTAVTFFYKHYSPELVERTVARARAFIAQQQDDVVEFRVGGGLFGVLAAMHTAVEHTYWRFLGVFLLCAALGGVLSDRSFRAAWGITAVVLLSQGVLLIVFWLGRIDLNVYTLPALVLCAGNILIPALLATTRDGHTASQASGDIATGLIVAVAGLVWLLSPFRLQSDLGLLFVGLALVLTVLPSWLTRLLRPEPA
jgi:predicted RND superfamily exporter protein